MPKDKRDIRRNMNRWITGQVGRRWDEVYSELRAMFDIRSDADYRVLEYVGVDVDCFLAADGQVLCNSAYNGPSAPYDLYVHPTTGLLCDAALARRCRQKRTDDRRKRTPVETIQVDNQRDYVLIEGIWYRLAFEYHGPDEVWKVYRFDRLNPLKYDDARVLSTYKDLRGPGDTHTIYYRDVPMQMRLQRGKFQCSKEEVEWITWFIAKARSGAVQAKWIMHWDRINQATATIVVGRLPKLPKSSKKTSKAAGRRYQGHPAPAVPNRVEVPKASPELLYEIASTPVVHRTAF